MIDINLSMVGVSNEDLIQGLAWRILTPGLRQKKRMKVCKKIHSNKEHKMKKRNVQTSFFGVSPGPPCVCSLTLIYRSSFQFLFLLLSQFGKTSCERLSSSSCRQLFSVVPPKTHVQAERHPLAALVGKRIFFEITSH